MNKLTTEEFKQKYKDALRSFADQMIQSDLNHIWDCCGEQLFEELEEEGLDVSEFKTKRLYDFLPDECFTVDWMKG